MSSARDESACSARGGLTRQEVKYAVRQRDGGKCTQCGMIDSEHIARYGRAMDVHRLLPATMYSVEGCVLLCRPCHGGKPKKRKGEVDPEYPNGRGYFVRVRLDTYLLLKKLAQRNTRRVSDEITRALVEHFRQQGLELTLVESAD